MCYYAKDQIGEFKLYLSLESSALKALDMDMDGNKAGGKELLIPLHSRPG